MNQIKEKECIKCGYTWQPHIENPKACPRCKSYSYWLRNKPTTGMRRQDPSQKENLASRSHSDNKEVLE